LVKITPLDIRQQQFHVKFRGFDPEEVDTFLEMVADELEDLSRFGELARGEVASLKEKNRDLSLEVQRLSEALEAAEKGKALTLEAIRADASEIRAQAAREAQTIIAAAKKERAETRKEMADLAEKRKQLIERVRSLLESQLRLLEMEELAQEAEEQEPRSAAQSEA
jgi:cell division initiation protein